MIIKVEQYQDKVYILDGGGNIWRFWIGYDRQPEIARVGELSHDQIAVMTRPLLPLYDRSYL